MSLNNAMLSNSNKADFKHKENLQKPFAFAWF